MLNSILLTRHINTSAVGSEAVEQWKSVGKIQIPTGKKSKGRGSISPINGL